MAAFVMQAMGCEVAALNTVQYSQFLFFALPTPLFLQTPLSPHKKK
jgi:pyridoxal/pyridoxine/pyridoxamine kinase